jgi:hypothetical protein
VGDHVFLKVKAKKSSLKLGSCSKLECYCGSFEILERIGPVAYMHSFPASMCIMCFMCLFLKSMCLDPNHVIDWTVIQVEHEGDFQVQLVHILDKKVKVLQSHAGGVPTTF